MLLRGERVPIIGRVTMDFIMVDAGPADDVHVGEIATLIGAEGSHAITVDEFAGWAGTVAYEILARLGARLQVSSPWGRTEVYAGYQSKFFGWPGLTLTSLT